MEKGDPVHKDASETKKEKATDAAKKDGHTQPKHSSGDKAALKARQQKKSERNFAKKMERRAGTKAADSPSREDVRRKVGHQKNVDGPQRERGRKESPSMDRQERASSDSQHRAGKSVGKKRSIDRKVLGKLVDANLRTDEVKGQNTQVTPKKEAERQEPWQRGRQEDAKGQSVREMNDSVTDETDKFVQSSGEAAEGSMEKQEAELEQTYIFKLAKVSI